MPSTVFELSLRVIVFTLTIAIATVPTCADQKSCSSITSCQLGKQKLIIKTTVTPSPYNVFKKAARSKYEVDVWNHIEIKRVNAKKQTVTSESTSTAAHCSVEEAAAADLGALLDAGEGALVTLVAGEARLAAHRAVLAARSPAFAALLCRPDQTSSGHVTVPDVEGPVLRQLLTYLYTLRAPQLPGMAPQLLAAADKFGLPALKEECEVQAATQLSVETAAATAVLALTHSSPGLWRAAVAFIRAHLLQVTVTQGWADAVHYHPQVVTELYGQLAETSTPATAHSQPIAEDQSQAHSDHGQNPVTTALVSIAEGQSQAHSDHGQTPVTAAPVSQPIAAGQSEATTNHGQTPVTAAPVSQPIAAGQSEATTDHGQTPVTAAPVSQPIAAGQSEATSDHGQTPVTAAPVSQPITAGQSEATSDHGQTPVTAAPVSHPIAAGQSEATTDHGQTPVTAAPVSQPIAAGQSEATSDYSQTPVAATPKSQPTTEAITQPDGDAVTYLQGLPAEERDRRLIQAVKEGAVAKVRALLEAGADVEARDGDSRDTALQLAAEEGHVGVVATLLRVGAKVDAKNSGESTALHFAAAGGHAAVVRRLVESSADPNARQRTQWTPLHYAALYGHAEAAAALLEAGADKRARNDKGNTPLDIARNEKNDKVIDMLT